MPKIHVRRRAGILVLLIFLFCLLLNAPALAADDHGAFLEQAGVLTQTEAAVPLTQPLSRGEFSALVNRTFGIYTTTGDKFSDVACNHRYYYDLMAAKTAGYLSGYPDGTVRPEEEISRLQAAVIFGRLLDLPQPQDGPVFADQSAIPGWGQAAAQRLVAGGVLQAADSGGNFDPDGVFTREMAYEALRRIIEADLQLSRLDEILAISSFDGVNLTGRLSLPLGEQQVDKLIVFVDGSGPGTYLTQRQTGDLRFKYCDIYAQAFVDRGAAYFAYNTRGVSTRETQPFYTIDAEAYQQYLPGVVAQNLAVMLEALRQHPRLAEAKVYLLGWSEGAIIAPLAVLEANVEVDGLLLAGYPNANLRDILEWQLGGAQTFMLYQIYFGTPGATQISRAEYEADRAHAIDLVFGGRSFEETDLDGDGYITVEDVRWQTAELYAGLMSAIERDDFTWIRTNYLDLTPAWFNSHFALGSTEDMLVQLDLPIHIFHGGYDLNCPVTGVYDLQARFAGLGKTNLTTHIFEQADHDLDFLAWLMTGTPSRGIAAILDTVAAL